MMIPKRGAIAGFLTAAGLALLLSFKTPETSNLTLSQGGNTAFTNGTTNIGSTGAGNGNAGNGNTTGNGNGGGTVAQGGSSGSGSSYSGTVTGQAVQIPFGTVQVQLTVQNGTITDVQALQMPSADRHSYAVSSYAAPQLRSEVLQAQSAQINTISGATYTSEGYIQSLQSALDQIPA
jgi:uncharacterized protein with FMN-binding domain